MAEQPVLDGREQRDGPLSRRPLTAIVRDHIGDQIIAGALAPGDAIPSEAAIARSLKVSKTVVREALRELAAFGMVEIRQGRATEVRPLDSEPLVHFFAYATRRGDHGLRDLMEMVGALETDAAARAALRHTPEQLAAIEATLLALVPGEPGPWNEANWAFHVRILEAAQNELMLYLYTALRRVIVAQKLYLHSQPDLRDPAKTYARQEAIVAAIRARDPVAAAQAMRRHFDHALDRVARFMAAAAAAAAEPTPPTGGS